MAPLWAVHSNKPMTRLLLSALLLLACASAQAITLAPTRAFALSAKGTTYDELLTVYGGREDVNNVGLMSFDISALSFAAGQNATLRLYHWANASKGTEFHVQQHRQLLPETLNSWDDLPDPYLRRFTFSLGAGSGQWYELDVSAALNRAFEEENATLGFTLMRSDEQKPYAMFSAVDANFFGQMHAPQLVVTSAVPEPATVALWLAGLGLWGLRLRGRHR